MKKYIVCTVLILCMTVALLSGCGSRAASEELTKVTLNEVAHSIFYAPQYAAIELGYFKDEGIDLELVTGFGADKTSAAVLSGEADIGFMGSESSIYIYNGDSDDILVNFAQLTQRAGNFLVSREPMEQFSWTDLKGKSVLGGRKGGMPEMVFEYILKKNGIDPVSDLSIDQSIDFGSTAAAFSGGKGNFTVEFEPSATALEQEQAGYVVASLGEASGYVPYTAYSAKTSYMEEHPDILQAFTNALQKGMDYVNTHTPEEIAKVIQPQFSETDLATITAIVTRYYDQKTWKENLIFEENSFLLLEDILEEAKELKARVPYEKLVTTEYAEKRPLPPDSASGHRAGRQYPNRYAGLLLIVVFLFFNKFFYFYFNCSISLFLASSFCQGKKRNILIYHIPLSGRMILQKLINLLPGGHGGCCSQPLHRKSCQSICKPG